MATRGKPRRGFGSSMKHEEHTGVPAVMLKQARQSGQLNLSNRSLDMIPDTVWRINIDVPEEGKTVSLDAGEDRWWEQVDLTKLILANNTLTSLSPDIQNLSALTVLDIHDNRLTSLPDTIGLLHQLTQLILSRNELHDVPACVWQLTQLKKLHLSHNHITSLHLDLGLLEHLEDLNISNNTMSTLPMSIGHLSRLLTLNVSHNKLATLPPTIDGLTALRYLDARHNELCSLPEGVAHLCSLQQLYVTHNHLTHLPVLTHCTQLKELYVGNNAIQGLTAEHLQHLSSVSILELRENKLSKLPDEITLLESIERLDITNNNISTLPYSLGSIVKLKHLILDGNPMKSIRRDIIMRGTTELKKYLCSRLPDETTRSGDAACSGGAVTKAGVNTGVIGGASSANAVNAHDVQSSKSLHYSNKSAADIPCDVLDLLDQTAITQVNFSKNALTSWPERLSSVTNSLVDVDISFNKISALPQIIGSFAKVTRLELRNNLLSTLPGELSNLQSLRELGLACNRFADIPGVVYKLAKLEILMLNDNQISSIDASGFCAMTQIATLSLQNNSIASIPPELGNCTQLRSLQLEGNCFRQPRPAILSKGTLAVLEYLRSRIVT